MGNTHIGSEGSRSIVDCIVGCNFTASESGTATSITAYIDFEDVGLPYPQRKYAIYDASLGRIETTLVDGGYGMDAWREIALVSSVPLVAGTTYWLFAWSSEGKVGNKVYVPYDDGGIDQGGYKASVYTGTYPPILFPEGYENRQYSIYITYTPSGTDEYDYVDTDISDVDGISDIGSHSQFENEKFDDNDYDILTEEDISGEKFNEAENYVDDNASDVDGEGDIGTHGNFTAQQYYDSNMDILTEALSEAGAGSEWLSVNDFDETVNDWDANAGADPWLNAQDEPTNYISELSSGGVEIGWFNFPDTSLQGIITTNISIYCKNYDGVGNDYADVYVDYSGAGAGSDEGDVGQHLDYSYDVISLGTHTVSEINSLRVKFIYQAVAGGDDLFIDHVRIGLSSNGVSNYMLDLEVQWTSADYDEEQEYLCIFMGSKNGSEDLGLDIWNTTSSDWDSLDATMTVSSWNNYSVSSYLTTTNLTIRYVDQSRSGDSERNGFEIECALLHTYSVESAYRFDSELKWENAVHTRYYEELCIETGTFSGSEDLMVYVWHSSSWNWVMNISASSDNNVTVAAYLDSSTFVIRLLGGIETMEGDATQDTWQIDYSLLRTRSLTVDFDLTALYGNNTGIETANVSLTNNDDTELFSVTTNSSGQISTQTVTDPKNPHTLEVWRLGIRKYVSVFNITNDMSLVITPEERSWRGGTKSTFTESTMPYIKTAYFDHTFYFVYYRKGFHPKQRRYLGLRPFVIHNGKFYNMKRMAQWLKNQGISYTQAMKKLKKVIHYGFNMTGIPPKIAEKIDYLGFKVVDYNFPLSAIKKQIIETDEFDYNITVLHINKINLHLSFQDLQKRGYSVSFINKTYCLIGNVRNQSFIDCDPIVYSSPIITIIGGIELNQLDYQDICDQNDVEGWGVVDAVSVNHFIINAKLVFGNGTLEGETWFSDRSKYITFEDALSTDFESLMYVEDYAYVTFGELVDESLKITKFGCTFHKADSYHAFLMDGASDFHQAVHFYSCKFSGDGSGLNRTVVRVFGITSDRGKLYNCVFDYDTSVQLVAQGYVDVYNLQAVSGGAILISVLGGSENNVIDTVTAMNYTYFAYDFENTIWRNMLILDETTTFVRYLSESSYLINVNSSVWGFSWFGSPIGEFYRQYEFDLTFTFDNGSYAEGTNVTISNSYLGTSDSWILTSNGSIPQMTYSMGHYNRTDGDSLYDYNPYNITATLDGFQTYTTLINITKKEHLTIALQEEGYITAEEVVRESIILLLGALFFSVLYELKRKEVWSAILGSGLWIVLSIVWLIRSTDVWIFSLIFSGIGIFYMLRAVLDLISMRQLRSKGLGDDVSV